jgi:hypothetical protein
MQAGDVATARELQFAANRIIAVLLRYGVIPGTKALLNSIGFRVGYGVPPMRPSRGIVLGRCNVSWKARASANCWSGRRYPVLRRPDARAFGLRSERLERDIR